MRKPEQKRQRQARSVEDRFLICSPWRLWILLNEVAAAREGQPGLAATWRDLSEYLACHDSPLVRPIAWTTFYRLCKRPDEVPHKRRFIDRKVYLALSLWIGQARKEQLRRAVFGSQRNPLQRAQVLLESYEAARDGQRRQRRGVQASQVLREPKRLQFTGTVSAEATELAGQIIALNKAHALAAAIRPRHAGSV